MYQPQSTPEDEFFYLNEQLLKQGFKFFELQCFLRPCFYEGKTEFKISFTDVDHATITPVNHIWQKFEIEF